MSINLSVKYSHPAAIATQVSYARIDNLPAGQSPAFTTVVPNLTGMAGTFTVATNVPDGQYQINALPIYADGRTCQPTVNYTAACPGLTSISAVIQSGVLVVTYLAPSGIPSVLINVGYPNGGSYSNIYVNDGNPISIGLPPGVYGNFTVNGQSVCDTSSGFYSTPSSTVNVTNAQALAGTYYLGATEAAACIAAATTLYSNGVPIPGTQLFQDETMLTPITGYSFVIYAGVNYNLSSSSGTLGAATGNSCNPTTVARNGLSFMTVSAITGIPGFVFNPTAGAFYQTGSHGAFTGAITIDLYGTVPSAPSFNISVYKNSVLQGCYNIPTGSFSGGYTTPSINATATDVIEIDISTGAC